MESDTARDEIRLYASALNPGKGAAAKKSLVE